jgi:hypothetical protein
MWPENTVFQPILEPSEGFPAFWPMWVFFYTKCSEVRFTGLGQVTVDTVIHGPPETIVSKDVELIDIAAIPGRIRGKTNAEGRYVFTNLAMQREYLAVAYDDNGEFNPPAARVVAVLPSAPEEPPPEEPA